MAFTPIDVRGPSSFKGPGQYEAYLKAEATGKASYLSSMDQFYAQLEEAIREFDVTSKYKYDVIASEEKMFGENLAEQQRQFNEELGWMREQWSDQKALEEAKLASTEAYQGRALDIEEEKLGLYEKEIAAKEGGTIYYDRAGVSEREKFDFYKQAFQSLYSSPSTPSSGPITIGPTAAEFEKMTGYRGSTTDPNVTVPITW